jgi:hypothetical protein
MLLSGRAKRQLGDMRAIAVTLATVNAAPAMTR